MRVSAHDARVAPADSREVSPDASAQFAAIQADLLDIGEGAVLKGVNRRDAFEFIQAVADSMSPREAKRVQLAAVGGRPLAVCFGHRNRRKNPRRPVVEDGVLFYLHFFFTYGDGCGRVFADESRVRFSRYCPACQGKPGGRHRQEALARAQAASEARFRVVRWDEEGKQVEAWRLTCNVCFERFETLEPRRRKCDRCHRGHRSPRT
jgi:hypothetical protein